MQAITRVPKVQPHFKGIINLRGEIVPVMSIRIKMGLPADVFTDATRIIILKLEEGMLGIIVDEVREVVSLGKDEIEKVATDGKSEKANFINGIGKYEGELISILDFNCIVDRKEAV